MKSVIYLLSMWDLEGDDVWINPLGFTYNKEEADKWKNIEPDLRDVKEIKEILK